MDSSRKRRLSQAATPSTSATKKLKLLNSHPAPSAPTVADNVQKVGLKLINQVTNAVDKNKRTIADNFLELPSRDLFPDYYQTIQAPIALDTIENKLRKNLYPTITAIESDFKLLILNAKEYNLPKSDIYEDAERIRKLVSNFMKTNNPVHDEPTFSAEATRIVEPKLILTNSARNGAVSKQDTQARPAGSKTRINLVNSRRSEPKHSEAPSERKSSAAPSESAGEGGDEGAEAQDSDANNVNVNGNGYVADRDFAGKSFQDAQRMIVKDLIERKDGDGGIEIFTPFVNLPSRKLEDYYKIIRHPVCLKSVQKRTYGIQGRDVKTGITDFKSWDAFEEEVSFVWRNCREYNEDGSEMYELAGEFEETFKILLAEAKSKVDEPAAKLKLVGPKAKPGTTIDQGQHRDSPTPGVSVDNDALLRQRQMVQAGVNGEQTHSRPTPPTNGAARPPSQGPAVVVPGLPNKAQSPSVATVKHEKMATMSPAPNAVPAVQPIGHGHVNGTMAPPVARPASGSPYPAHPGMPPPATSYHFTAPAALPPTPLRSYPIAQALLPVVAISTLPQLQVPKPYRLAIPPHPSLSHQSTTITLPPSHHILQIAPTISKELSMGRPYKMFVTLNGGRLTQRDTQFHADSGKRTHVYEGQLASGVNRIEVEVAAAKVDTDAKGLDIEKATIFVSLK